MEISYQKNGRVGSELPHHYFGGIMKYIRLIRRAISKATGSLSEAARSFIINPVAIKGIVPVKWHMLPGIAVLKKHVIWDSMTDLNDIIDIKVQERTTELEDSRKQLESFAYSVSHDLKAPLRVINGYCSIMRNAPEMYNADGNEIVQIISENALRMSRLIDDLLKFAQTGCENLTKTTTDMNTMVRVVINELSGGNILKTKINIHSLPDAHCDPRLIRQVWINLISNAIKYSSKNPRPVIHIGAEIIHGVQVYYVSDNGAGFDMKYADKLFNAFQRLHTTEDYEGTGVGLALTHRIISKHGGKIWADAQPGKGAKFSFTLEEMEPGS